LGYRRDFKADQCSRQKRGRVGKASYGPREGNESDSPLREKVGDSLDLLGESNEDPGNSEKKVGKAKRVVRVKRDSNSNRERKSWKGSVLSQNPHRARGQRGDQKSQKEKVKHRRAFQTALKRGRPKREKKGWEKNQPYQINAKGACRGSRYISTEKEKTNERYGGVGFPNRGGQQKGVVRRKFTESNPPARHNAKTKRISKDRRRKELPSTGRGKGW